MKTLFSLLLAALLVPVTANCQTVSGGGLPNISTVSGTLPVANGGTGAITAAAALTNLSAVPIGTVAAAAMDNGTWLSMNGQVVSQATYPALFKIIGHQPEFTWTGVTVGTADLVQVNQIAFGNSTYVAVAASGKIYTSANLTTWSGQTSGVATALNDVTWDSDNSLFVAVGASNVILTSADGATWSSKTSGVTSTLAHVVHANGRTVAVGSSGWVSYSTDDSSWTATQPNSGPSLKWLFYANSTWFSAEVAASSTGIVYSTNGTTWNYVAKPTTNSSDFLGFDATNFYLADNITGQVYSSTTGASWSSVTSTLNWPIKTNSSESVAIFSSGIVYVCNGGGVAGYTDNGFTSLKRTLSINGSLNLNTGSGTTQPVVNPLGNASVTFALISATVVSVDGKKLSTYASCPFGTSFIGNVPYRANWANGNVFIFGSAPGSGMAFAPAPYTPSTHFQIPTNTDTTGTALVIKAL